MPRACKNDLYASEGVFKFSRTSAICGTKELLYRVIQFPLK